MTTLAGLSGRHSAEVGRMVAGECGFNRSFVAASLKGFRRVHCVHWMLVSSPHVSLLLARFKANTVPAVSQHCSFGVLIPHFWEHLTDS